MQDLSWRQSAAVHGFESLILAGLKLLNAVGNPARTATHMIQSVTRTNTRLRVDELEGEWEVGFQSLDTPARGQRFSQPLVRGVLRQCTGAETQQSAGP